MTLPVELNPNHFGARGYTVPNSLRFRQSASAYLSRTPGVAGNRQIWTWSGWIKRGLISGNVTTTNYAVFSAGSANPGGKIAFDYGTNTDGVQVNFFAGTNAGVVSTSIYRDITAWYHVVVALDTTQATAANRVKIYINGNLLTAMSSTSYPSQNTNYDINNTVPHNIGRSAQASTEYFDGYLAEINFVDGQSLTASSFGQNDSTTGAWIPKKYTGTYGTNGFYLKFTDASAATAAAIGKDSSGNGNNWTPNGISVTSGVTYDSMTDTPTAYDSTHGNYCVMNPLDPGCTAPTGGNLNISHPQNDNGTFGTFVVTSGRWWAECAVTTGPYMTIGVCNAQAVFSPSGTGYANAYWYQGSNGNKLVLGTTAAYGSTYTTGDVVGIDLNIGAGTITFYKQTAGSGSFVSQGAITLTANAQGFKFISVNAASTQGTMAVAWNFGQRPFNNSSIPSGCKALNTFNLPAPSLLPF